MRAPLAALLIVCAGAAGAVLAIALPERTVAIYVDVPFHWFLPWAPADFQVTIDDSPVTIAAVVPGPQPLNAVALLDVSNSMPSATGDAAHSPDAQKAASRLAGVAKAGDAIRLGTFAKRILIGRTLLTDAREVEAAVREVDQQGGPSPLWDAIDRAVASLAGRPGLPAVVVYSDGQASGNDLAFDEVMTHVINSGVTVSVIGVSDEALMMSRVEVIGRNEGLQRLVTESGGRYAELRDRKEQGVEYLAALVANLRGRYRLDVMPPRFDGRQYRLTVTAHNMAVRAPASIVLR